MMEWMCERTFMVSSSWFHLPVMFCGLLLEVKDAGYAWNRALSQGRVLNVFYLALVSCCQRDCTGNIPHSSSCNEKVNSTYTCMLCLLIIIGVYARHMINIHVVCNRKVNVMYYLQRGHWSSDEDSQWQHHVYHFGSCRESCCLNVLGDYEYLPFPWLPESL